MLSEEPINDRSTQILREAFGLERSDIERIGHRLILFCLHVPGNLSRIFGHVLDILQGGFVDVRDGRENHLVNALFVHSNFGEGVNLGQLAAHLPRDLVSGTQILAGVEQ